MIARGLVFNELSAACLGEANAARVAQCDRQGANPRVHSGEHDTACMRRLNRLPAKKTQTPENSSPQTLLSASAPFCEYEDGV
jgi:hypothetical protein